MPINAAAHFTAINYYSTVLAHDYSVAPSLAPIKHEPHLQRSHTRNRALQIMPLQDIYFRVVADSHL